MVVTSEKKLRELIRAELSCGRPKHSGDFPGIGWEKHISEAETTTEERAMAIAMQIGTDRIEVATAKITLLIGFLMAEVADLKRELRQRDIED